MPLYNIRNTELVWRGLTLSGFSDVKVGVSQEGQSNTLVIGIAGENFIHPNNKRQCKISSSFSINSYCYPILEQDNLNNIEDTLIVRDLNIGTSDIYTNCVIMSITSDENSTRKTVTWHAIKRNGR